MVVNGAEGEGLQLQDVIFVLLVLNLPKSHGAQVSLLSIIHTLLSCSIIHLLFSFYTYI